MRGKLLNWRLGNEKHRLIWGQILSTLILVLASGLGVWGFLFPFFTPAIEQEASRGQAHAQDAPLIFVLFLGLCLVVIVANLETGQMDARLTAVLGILVGLNATLRLIPGPAGFSAIFFLPILCGYVFGPTFGFLLGALSTLVSAIMTGGMGPWLPFQMFAAGWVAVVAGWLPQLPRNQRLEVLLLAGWGFFSGFLFGLVMNLWFWPYLAAPGGDGEQAGQLWQPGLGLGPALLRYSLFYLTTSLWWDIGRAAGNFLLLLFVGLPTLRLLRRFQQRFHFTAF